MKSTRYIDVLCSLIALLISLCSTTVYAQPDTVEQTVEQEESVTPVVAREGVKIYTLPEAIKQALTVSPSIDSAKYELEGAQAQYDEANAARILPQIDLKVLFGVTPNVPDGSGPENNFPEVNTAWTDLGPFTQIRLEGYQPIYTFGKIANLRKAALQGIEGRVQGVEKAKNDLTLLVKKAYIGLTSLYSFKEFLEDLRSRSQKAQEVVNKQIQQKNSGVTDIDVMRIEVFLAETDRRLVEINNGIKFTLDTLKILMGLPRDSKIDVADQRLHMDNTVIAPVETYLEIARENRPDIMQLQNLVSAREAGMKVAKSSFFPSLGLAGFYRYGYAPGREDVDNPFLVDDFNNNSGGGFLVLSQSLSFHLTRARWKQAVAQYDKALADEQRALQGIEVEIRKAHFNASSKQQAVEAAKRGFKSGRSWILAASLNFGVGITSPKDLLEAFVGYTTVKINYLQTLNDYFLAMADLSNAIGKEVADNTTVNH